VDQGMTNNFTHIRISKEAHHALKVLSLEQNKSICNLIDEMLNIKKEMTMVEKLLAKKK